MEDGVWMENGNITSGGHGMHQEENPLPMSGNMSLFETCMSEYLGLFETCVTNFVQIWIYGFISLIYLWFGLVSWIYFLFFWI